MKINWIKKNKSLQWSIGCGISYVLYQGFILKNIFSGKVYFWEDILFSIAYVSLPIVAVFLLYWPNQKNVKIGFLLSKLFPIISTCIIILSPILLSSFTVEELGETKTFYDLGSIYPDIIKSNSETKQNLSTNHNTNNHIDLLSLLGDEDTALAPLTKELIINNPQELFKVCSPSVVRIRAKDDNGKIISKGSGFFISSKGILATNYHVIENAIEAEIVLYNDKLGFVDGIVAEDKTADIVLLAISQVVIDDLDISTFNINNSESLPEFEYLSSILKRPLLLNLDDIPPEGTKVYAIGNPKGLTNTISEGIISGIRTLPQGFKMIQTSASVSPGSSGGPLMLIDGTVVGMITSSYIEGQNINFAVNSSFINQLVNNYHKLLPLWLGKSTKKEEENAIWEMMNSWMKSYAAGEEPEKYIDLCRLGNLNFDKNLYDSARENFIQSISIKPDYYLSHYLLGQTYFRQKRYGDAVKEFKKSISLAPRFASAYSSLAESYLLLNLYKDRRNAIAAQQKVVQLVPQSHSQHSFLAFIYSCADRHLDALISIKTAISLKPNSGDYYDTMGVYYVQLNQYKQAAECFEKALKYGVDPLGVNPGREEKIKKFLPSIYKQIK